MQTVAECRKSTTNSNLPAASRSLDLAAAAAAVEQSKAILPVDLIAFRDWLAVVTVESLALTLEHPYFL